MPEVPLSAADVFVLSTHNEGWANVFLEAMACGTCVVVNDTPENMETIGEAGFGYHGEMGGAALREVLERSHDRRVRRRDLEREALHRDVAMATISPVPGSIMSIAARSATKISALAAPQA